MESEQVWQYFVLRNNGKIAYNGKLQDTTFKILSQEGEPNQKYSLLKLEVNGKSASISYSDIITAKNNKGEILKEWSEETRARLTLNQLRLLSRFPQRTSGDIGAASRAYNHDISDKVEESKSL